MRQETQHPLKLSPEEQKHLLVGFEKTMVCVAGNERALISKIAYNRFKLWNQELLDAARERKDDVELKKALEAWSLLELAVEKPIIYDSAANFLRIGAWANAKGAKSRAEAIAGLIQEHAKGNKRLGNCVVLAREFPESPQYAEVELLENAEYGRRLANRAGTETSPADRRYLAYIGIRDGGDGKYELFMHTALGEKSQNEVCRDMKPQGLFSNLLGYLKS